MGLQIRTKTIFHCNRDVATDNITCPCQGQLIFEGLVSRATVTKTLSKLLLACRSKRSLMGLRKSSFARFDFVRLLNIGYCCGYTWNLKPKRWIAPRVLRDKSFNCIVYQRWKNTIWSNHACRYRLYSKETWLENVSTNVKKNSNNEEVIGFSPIKRSHNDQSCSDLQLQPAPVCMPRFKLFILLTNLVHLLNYFKCIKICPFSVLRMIKQLNSYCTVAFLR